MFNIFFGIAGLQNGGLRTFLQIICQNCRIFAKNSRFFMQKYAGKDDGKG